MTQDNVSSIRRFAMNLYDDMESHWPNLEQPNAHTVVYPRNNDGSSVYDSSVFPFPAVRRQASRDTKARKPTRLETWRRLLPSAEERYTTYEPRCRNADYRAAVVAMEQTYTNASMRRETADDHVLNTLVLAQRSLQVTPRRCTLALPILQPERVATCTWPELYGSMGKFAGRAVATIEKQGLLAKQLRDDCSAVGLTAQQHKRGVASVSGVEHSQRDCRSDRPAFVATCTSETDATVSELFYLYPATGLSEQHTDQQPFLVRFASPDVVVAFLAAIHQELPEVQCYTRWIAATPEKTEELERQWNDLRQMCFWPLPATIVMANGPGRHWRRAMHASDIRSSSVVLHWLLPLDLRDELLRVHGDQHLDL